MLVAASAGWMLDAFVVMLFAMLLATLIPALQLTTQQAGILVSVPLLTSALGGLAFGVVADRYGRVRALVGSILVFSIFTGLSALAGTFWQLVVLRACVGLGMGGEWACGASLVSETWPAAHRGKAMGFMQSTWAIGYGLAALITALVLPLWGWRAVLACGLLPVAIAPWIVWRIYEPPPASGRREDWRLADIFRGRLGRLTAAITAMNACTLFGWWGMNAWVPAYLSLPPDRGGIGMSTGMMTSAIVTMQVGTWLGFVLFGYASDRFGLKRTYVTYVLTAAALLPLYSVISSPALLVVLGPVVAFFGTGYFSGFGVLTSRIYPRRIRATGQGFTYNTGRMASAAAPFAVGSLASGGGFGLAFGLTGIAFLLAACTWFWIPGLAIADVGDDLVADGAAAPATSS